MPSTLTICDTCRHTAEIREIDGKTGGATLLEAVQEVVGERGQASSVRAHSCLMGCSNHCTAALQSDGKITYVLGRFDPNRESAEALLDYAALYDESETGQVPFKQWPQGIKGHFMTRVPAVLEQS